MTNFYVDTSALNKRYIAEVGSTWVRSWVKARTGNLIMVSDLAAVESFSVYARLRREGRITSARHARLQALFLGHLRQYLVLPVTAELLTQARLLVNSHPLKTLDAVQLASALRGSRILGQPITFVTADKQLRAAALSEGFTVEDPNAHP